MRKIILLLLCPLSVCAKDVKKEFESKILNTESWSQVSEQLKETLPLNVVDEFTAATKEIPYPSTRRFKNTIQITHPNGNKAFMKFEKYGVVIINKKEWQFDPLANVSDEIKRLEDFISGEKKSYSYFSFISEAHAAAFGAASVASLAYARGTEWKGKACGESDLSEAQMKECPLMAVGMQPMVIKASASSDEDNKKMLPIDLKCPDRESGTLQMIFKNRLGWVQVFRLNYEKSEPTTFYIARAKEDGVFEDLLNTNLKHPESDDAKFYGQKLLPIPQNVYTKVCKGNQENRNKYLAMLDRNRASLLSQASLEVETNDSETKKAL